jgi:CDP-diacylglycerol--serine O-phosphatidyltransferase
MKRHRKHHHLRHPLPLRNLVPNLATGMAAACGITSIRFSCAGQWHWAVVFILVAGLFDGIDGRLARLLGATSRLGAELDSLSDFVCFGVAPALLVYFWAALPAPDAAPLAPPISNLLWAFALFYALCGAFRLARFNIMLEEPTTLAWKHFFMGLPAPGGAALCMLPLVWERGFGALPCKPAFASVSLLVCGILLACRIPTPSIKKVHVSQKWRVPFLLFLLLTIAFLVSDFWRALCVIAILYYLSIPVCSWVFLRLSSRLSPDATLPPSFPSDPPSPESP